ncbi:hypothetical protein ABZ027_40780 [Streptomyces sp. NPDC006332]
MHTNDGTTSTDGPPTHRRRLSFRVSSGGAGGTLVDDFVLPTS